MIYFSIYLIGTIINFIATYYFWVKLSKNDPDISESWSGVILFTLIWPIMDILLIGFYFGGICVIGVELLIDFIKRHKNVKK